MFELLKRIELPVSTTYTGVEGNKRVSVEYHPLKRSWKLTTREGKKIYLIPSDRVLIKRDKIPQGVKPKDLKRYFRTKYKEFLFDFTVDRKTNSYTLVLVRDFQPPPEAFALDAEPFSLARLAKAVGEGEITVLDIGKRKTTYVKVDTSDLASYRVVLRGGDYITQRVAKELSLSFEEAERLKIEKGLELPAVKKAIEEILSDLPPLGEKVVLSGGGALLKELPQFLGQRGSKVVEGPKGVKPTEYPALGGALKFIYRDRSPTFKAPEVGPSQLKAAAFVLSFLILSFFLGTQLLMRVKTDFYNRIAQKEKELFSEKFPQLPPVAVLEQLKTLRGQKKESVLPLFEKLIDTIPRGVKIYRLSYGNGVLKVEGEAPSKEIADKLKAVSLKRTDSGSYLFEVEIR